MSGYQPLLTSDLNEAIPSPYRNGRPERHVVFAIDDEEDEEEHDNSPESRYVDDERSARTSNGNPVIHAPRIAPPLKSTFKSREAGEYSCRTNRASSSA